MKRIIFYVLFFASLLVAQSESSNIDFFLKGTNITDIHKDGNDLWITTNGSGIFLYRNEQWEHFATSNGNIQHDYFFCITSNKDYVWAGSIDGLFTYDKKRKSWSKRKFGLGGQLANWIRSIEYDRYANVVWIGRFKYLTKYDLKTRRYIDYDLTVGGNNQSNTIKTIKVEGDSVVWFGTEAGLHKYDKSKDLTDPSAMVFFDNSLNYFNGEGEQISISSILSERNYLWIGLDEFITEERPEFNTGGLFRYDRLNDWLRFDVTNGLTGNGVYDLTLIGNYICASLYQFGIQTKEPYGRGLVLINRLNNQVIPVRDSRIPSTVNKLFFDGSYLWLGTNDGLIRINFINELAQWK